MGVMTQQRKDWSEVMYGNKAHEETRAWSIQIIEDYLQTNSTLIQHGLKSGEEVQVPIMVQEGEVVRDGEADKKVLHRHRIHLSVYVCYQIWT